MNAKISLFIICVEAIMYLYNLLECTCNNNNNNNNNNKNNDKMQRQIWDPHNNQYRPLCDIIQRPKAVN